MNDVYRWTAVSLVETLWARWRKGGEVMLLCMSSRSGRLRQDTLVNVQSAAECGGGAGGSMEMLVAVRPVPRLE